MDVTLNKPAEMDLVAKIRAVTEMCKVSRLENMMYEFFDNLSDDNLSYILVAVSRFVNANKCTL